MANVGLPTENTVAADGKPEAEKDAQGFIDKAKNVLFDLLEVKVVTVVGNLPVSINTRLGGDDTKTTLGTTPTDLSKAIVTIVKLADGDVTTVIADDLVENAELRAMHTAQVTESLEVLPRNLKALVELAQSILKS
jgi:hypothetical protein